jgi:SET domain-containing protein
MSNEIEIKPSAIHGFGAFAAKSHSAGETVIDHRGCTEVLTAEEVQVLPEEEKRYLSRIEGEFILFRAPARFVNHSCEPNLRGELGRDVAIRAIAPGEELTVDYVSENVPGLDLHCSCGKNHCRGRLFTPPLEF